MQIHITSDEFRRLSPATQRELLSLLIGDDGTEEDVGAEDFDALMGGHSEHDNARQVININKEQTVELLANLAERSQQTLRMFALAERVEIVDLVGEGKPYKDMNDLKRSFVGAVNRRLRTVVGHRGAVLFSSDRDKKRIRVLPMTASALKHVMGIEAPLDPPTIERMPSEDRLEGGSNNILNESAR